MDFNPQKTEEVPIIQTKTISKLVNKNYKKHMSIKQKVAKPHRRELRTFSYPENRVIIVSNINYIREKSPKKERTRKKKSIFNFEKENGSKSMTKGEKFKKNFLEWMDKPGVIIYMSALTFFALFLSDIQGAWCPPSVDFAFDIIKLYVFTSFTVEIILCSYSDATYFCSLFFWLDVISTLSLLIDIGFVFGEIIESIFQDYALEQARLTLSKISTASGTTRVLRILRIIKLIRIINLYKSIHQAKVSIARKKERKKIQLKMLLNRSRDDSISGDTSMRNLEFHKLKLIENENEMDNINMSPSIPTGPVSRNNIFVSSEKKTNIVPIILGPNEADKNKEEETKDDPFAKVQNMDDASEEIIKESNISRMIITSLINKIFFLVMIVLIVYPILAEDFYTDESQYISYQVFAKYLDNYSCLSKEKLNEKIINYIQISSDSFIPLINITYNSTLLYENKDESEKSYRSSEIKSTYSTNELIVITYSIVNTTKLTSMLNFFRTIFVCVIIGVGVWFIESETREYVLEPLEVMMEIIDTITNDPINAKNIELVQSGTKATIDKMKKHSKELETSQYEIQVIKNSIIKISGLLAMGFGQIGGKLIKKNMIKFDEMQLYDGGKYVAGIYSVVSIRYYNFINQCLHQKIVILTNEINEIIHSSIDRYSGFITKNLGDCCLSIFKFTSKQLLFFNEGKTNASSKMTSEQCDTLITNISDLALLSCLHIYRKIQKKLYNLEYLTSIINTVNPNFKVEVDLNLHSGLSIEGVIGSSSKLDAVHLSNKLLITRKLRHLNKYYGVYILFSDTVFNNLSDTLKVLCRPIDVVHFPFDNYKKYKLYTIDIQESYNDSNKSLLFTKQEKELISEEKKRIFYKRINDVGSVVNYVLSKRSFEEILDNNKTDEFFIEWEKGFNLYENGNWKEAYKSFKNCMRLSPNDKPGQFLMKEIEDFNYAAPDDWIFGREIVISQ